MILDHPLLKAFTIEEGALVAVDLLQYNTIKDGLAGSYSSIRKNTKLSSQTELHDFTEQINLAQEILSIFKQAYLDGVLIPYVDSHIDDLDSMLFCRKSLFSLLQGKGKDCTDDVNNKLSCRESVTKWLASQKYLCYNFRLDENKAFSSPSKYVSLVHDNQYKIGFTPSEIVLMFYDIGSISIVKNIPPHEKNFFKPSGLTKESLDKKVAENYKISVNWNYLCLVKNILVVEAKRVIQNLTSVLVIERAPLQLDSQRIDYELLTFTRESIHKYLTSHNLKMQAKLFDPYETKLRTLSPKILGDLRSESESKRNKNTIELAILIWDWAYEKYNVQEKITQGQCADRYKNEIKKSDLSIENYQAIRKFKTEISKIAQRNGFKFTQHRGLQKIVCCA
jgi:hypothetical protein